MHIFDFRWNDDSCTPYFQYIQKNTLKEAPLVFEQPFFLTVENDSLKCVGHKKQGQYIPCPHNSTGTKKCESCKKAEDYFPCQFCNGFNCDRFRSDKIENCDADHMVYLALFAPDIIKVGVSRLSRMKARQFEQGSHFTRVFLAGVSGIRARRIESFLGKLGFPDKIPATRKKDILFPQISKSEGEKLLEEKFQFAKENLHHQMPEMLKYVQEDEFWDMREHYGAGFLEIESGQKAVHFVDLEEGESVGGTLRAVKGSFLMIETPSELVILLAKKLVGKHISLDPCAQGITKNGGFQGGLF